MSDTAPRTPEHPGTDVALSLLATGVPLSLLLDLAAAVPSQRLYREEQADTGWVPALTG